MCKANEMVSVQYECVVCGSFHLVEATVDPVSGLINTVSPYICSSCNVTVEEFYQSFVAKYGKDAMSKEECICCNPDTPVVFETNSEGEVMSKLCVDHLYEYIY